MSQQSQHSEYSRPDVVDQGGSFEDDDVHFNLPGVLKEELDKQLFTAEHIWFINMLMLGFNPQAEQKKHSLAFNEEMFRRPNEKGMEVVLHFLFQRLLGSKAKEVCELYMPAHSTLFSVSSAQTFRLVWPVHDKTQSRDFKKLVFTLLQQLEKEDHLPPNTIRQSHIQTCSGERYILHVLAAFASFLLLGSTTCCGTSPHTC
jgi:hypothetical protein